MKKVVIGIIIAVIIVVVGFVPVIEVPYTVTVQYLDTETYYETVPEVRTYTYYEEVPAGSRDLITGYSPDRGYNVTWEERQGVDVFHKKVEKERVVIKERLETHYKKVPIFEYLLSRL